MLCDKFAESWFNGRHTLARRKLRPFCLWHQTYLQFINSPLTPGDNDSALPEVEWSDIEIASRICQLGYQEQLPSLGRAGLLALRARLFITMAKKTKEQEITAYWKYVSDFFGAPSFNSWKSAGAGIQHERGGPPDPLSVASACLMLGVGNGQPGGAEKYIWEMPIGQAYWYSSTLHYNRGAPLDYMTAKDEAIRKFLREQRQLGKI